MYEYALNLKKKLKGTKYNGDIPELRVINEDGLLKGFVSVPSKVPFFVYSDLLEASDFAYQNDSKGKAKLLKKSDLSHFDLSGYEKVNNIFIDNPDKPCCTIKNNHMKFNKICLSKMDNSDYIEILYEPHEDLLAIRCCEKSHRNNIEWTIKKEEKTDMRNNSCIGLFCILQERYGWKDNYRIKLYGTTRTKDDESIIIFDLRSPLIEMSDVDADGNKSKVALYDKYYNTHFGIDFYGDSYANRLYLMDVFKKWNVGASLSQIKDEEEFITRAKDLVNSYVKQLEGGGGCVN